MRICTVLLCFITISFTLLGQPGTAVSGQTKAIDHLIEQAVHAESFGHFDIALKLYGNILQQSKAQNYRPGIVAWHSGNVYILCQQRQPDKALPLAHAFQKWVNEKNDPLEQAHASFLYASIYRMKMNFDSSFYFLEQTLQQLSQTKDPVLEAKAYGSMSYNYAKMEIPDNALLYGTKALELYRKMNDSTGVARTMIFLAPAYNLMDDPANWYAYCSEGLRLAKQIQNPVLTMQGYNNLALYYMNNEKEDSVLPALNEAYQIAQREGFAAEGNEIAVNMADEHNFRKEFDKSIALLKKIYADTALHPLPVQRLHLSQLVYYDALKGLERYKEAGEMLEQYVALTEKLYQDKSRQKALETDERLRTSEPVKKLAEKQLQVKKQTAWILALGFALTAAFFLILFLRKKQQAGRQQIYNLQKEKELEKVRAQLSGQVKERIRVSKEIHDDLGSSLTALGLLTELLQRQPEFRDNPHILKISASTREMITRMNDIIWSVNTHNDTTSSLLAHIRKFAAEFLQQAGISLNFNDDAAQEDHPLNSNARRNIYLTVKEAVHNIVKHSGAQHASIDTVIENGELKITVTDDGQNASSHLAGNGQGLQNMKMRMEEIGGQWHMETGNGTKISLGYRLDATDNEAALPVR